MKTAISIPDETFQRAERRAHELGISRSQLYSTAVERLLDNDDGRDVTDRIDQVLSASPHDEDIAFLSRAAAEMARRSETA